MKTIDWNLLGIGKGTALNYIGIQQTINITMHYECIIAKHLKIKQYLSVYFAPII